MKKKEMLIYTDGSSLGNPGAGGWGSLFLVNGKVMEMGGYQKGVTNNQMELRAIEEALKKLAERKVENYKISLYSDSQYCIKGIKEWIDNWKKNNWKNSAKKDVKNREYWERIDDLKNFLELENELDFFYMKAHDGQVYNERVDDIARIMAKSKGKKPKLFRGALAEWKKMV